MFKFVSSSNVKSDKVFKFIFDFQLTIFLIAVIGLSAAKPQFIVSPEIVSPIVTAQSSQYIARNYNGVAASYVVDSPVVSAYSAYSAFPAVYPSYVL